MQVPPQQLIPPDQDLLYAQMSAAYDGDGEAWRAVTCSLRDAMVDWARRHSPYYRERIPSGARFEDIPILTKQDLREHLDDLLAVGVPESRRFPDRTSGSTGEPVHFFRDTAQQLAHTAAADRFYRTLHGVPLEATLLVVSAVGRPAERRDLLSRRRQLARRVRARLGGWRLPRPWLFPVTMADLTPRDVATELRRWARFQPYFVLGHASGIDWIADQAERRGIEIPVRPAAVCTNSDLLTEPARRRIERVFGAPVHTRYGSSELRWVAVSAPGTTNRYLFNPLMAYVEVLDASGEPVAPGEQGSVVMTDLNNFVMPLIRYEQGDRAIASAEEFVGGYRQVEDIVGRSSELLILPSGKVLSGVTVGNYLFLRHEFAPWIRFFQCAQTGPNELELRVVWSDGADEDIRAQMANALREICDPDTRVWVRDVDELDRLPSGKAWIVRREFEA